MVAKVSVENLSLKLGSKKIFENFNIQFEENQIHGLIGRNGAGKTILMKLICGLCRPDSGNLIVNCNNIGAIIETPGFLNYFSGYNNLKFLADIRKEINYSQIENILQFVGLKNDMHKKVSSYSMGMRQRLGIAQAIMENQDLIILDEPFNGLDNQGVLEIRELLIRLKGEGVTIILASHNTDDIRILCDTVTELDNGKIVFRQDTSARPTIGKSLIH